MAALDTAHASLALGLETLVAPRMSSADPRPRHRGLSHHTATVLRMLLRGVRSAPALIDEPSPPDFGIATTRSTAAQRHAATGTSSGP